MSKVAVGSIPKKISYVSSEEVEVAVGCAWDISWGDDEDGTNSSPKQKVLPTFPIDPTDAKGMARAIAWASDNGYNWNTRSKITSKPQIEEVDNLPIKDIRVLSLEERGQGGRAYKVLVGRYYVDLREDVMMDTMLQVGIDAGGILKGEYVWAKMGSQTKLVRVGSELHRLLTEFESKKDIKPVGKGDLEVGGIYQDRKKNRAIFVGYVNTVTYKSLDPTPYYNRNGKADFKYKKTVIKKAMLFYEFIGTEKIDKVVKEMKKDNSHFYYKIKKSHTYIEKVDQITIPNNITDYLRDKALKDVKGRILEYTGHKLPEKNYAKITASYLENHIEYVSNHINLYSFGEPEVEPFEIKKFLLFS